MPLRTPIRLVTPLFQSSITRNYNHSQLFRTLLCVYTIRITYTLVIKSLITLLHVYTGWLFSYIFTLPVSPIEISLVEQTSIDTSPTVAGVSQWRDCLLRCLGDACDVTAACSSPLAERGVTQRTPLPVPRSEAYSGQLTRNALLRNPTMGWLVTIFLFRGVGWDWVHLVLRPVIGLLYQPQMTDEYGAFAGTRIVSNLRKPWPSATLSTTHPT
jgi:hypothetical protein